jgi:hypothetical protein
VNRRQVEHVLRAAAAISEETEFIVVGSQAALVQHQRLPAAMLRSPELDLYPARRPELADMIDGSIGEGSPFHRTFGYYGQGVGPETAKLPAGWRDRAFRLSNDGTRGAVAIAPELHDLCVAKLVAGREKDFGYVAAALDGGLVDPTTLAARLDEVPDLDPRVRDRAVRWLAGRPGRQGGKSQG